MLVLLVASCLVAGSYSMLEEGMKCYGTYNFAARDVSPRHYYSCKGVGTVAELKECAQDQIYDSRSGLCIAGEVKSDGRIVKRSEPKEELKVIEREALGETISVGTMYDARKSLVQNGASFWNKATLDTEVNTMDTVYSNVDVFMENNINERSYALSVDASLKLEFLGGLISVGGSAHYLRDETSSSDVARVTMNYKSTKKTKTLPIKTPKDHTDLCNKISKTTGPTHVVTSVTYGLRSYLLFERDVQKTEYKEEVGGSLQIAVNTVPSFSIEGQAAVDVNGKALVNQENLRVKFYGDVIITNMPATYNQTVFVFDEVNKAAKEQDTPVKFQLTPIEFFCDGTEATINEINDYLQGRVTNILTELADMKKRVKTLLGRDPSIRFTSIKSQLLTFQAGLAAFTTEITADVASLLPALKTGEANEVELNGIVGKYMESIWNKDVADVFLDHRAREIRTIELVTEEAKQLTEVSLSDIGAATDNKCIFNHKYATVYQLYVLPAQNVAQLYVDSQYTKETEQGQWYNDLYRVGQAGANLNKFLAHAKINAGDDHCFLIRLDNLSNNNVDDKDALIRLFKNGKVVEEDFAPPQPPKSAVCERSLYSGFDLSGVRNTESTSHVTAIKVKATWRQESAEQEEGKEKKYDYFPTEKIVGNTDKFNILGLEPNKEYAIELSYRVGKDMGYSGASVPVTCKTGATSAPVLPQVSAHTSNSVSLQWSAPQQHVVPLSDVKYVVTASVNGEAKRQIETPALTVTLDQLEQGTYYDFSIQPFYQGVGSEKARLSFATVPYPPDVPLLESRTTSSMELIVYIDRMTLPKGMTKDALLITYYKMNSKGSKQLYGTEKAVTVAVSSQTSPQVVSINGLDSGSKYGVRCTLRVRAAGKLFETDPSEAIIVTTELPSGDFDQVNTDVTNYIASSNTAISNLETKTNSVTSAVNTFSDTVTRKVGELNTKIAQVETQSSLVMSASEKLIAGLSRNGCVRRGVRYDGTQLGKLPNIKTEYNCLKECKSRWSNTGSITLTIEPSPDAGECKCMRERRGYLFDTNGFYSSISSICWNMGQADNAKWNSCTMFNKSHSGGVIATLKGTGSIKDCAMACAYRDNCDAVTYKRNTGECILRRAGSQGGTLNHADSLNISCLV